MSDTDTTAGTAVSEPADDAPSTATVTAPAAPEPDLTPEELVAAMESSFRDFKDGDIVEGDVVKIDRDEVLLDIGYKSEGVIPPRSCRSATTSSPPRSSRSASTSRRSSCRRRTRRAG